MLRFGRIFDTRIVTLATYTFSRSNAFSWYIGLATVGAHGQKNVSESCNRGVMISSRQIPDRTSNFRALFAGFSLTFGRSPRRKNKDRCFLRQFLERLGNDLGLC